MDITTLAMGEQSPASDVVDLFGQRLAEREAALPPAGRRVARFIDQNRAAVLASSALELAASTGTSDATVVRSVQALGFTGLGDLKQALVAALGRASTPADAMDRTLAAVGADTARAVDLVIDAHAEAFAALREASSRERIVTAVKTLHPASRIVVFGIGPSAALADYVSLLLERAGRRTKKLNATGTMLADQMLDLRHGDALLALAYGRPYREVSAVLAEGRRLGLPVVLVTDSPGSRLGRSVDVVLAAQRGQAGKVALHGATLVGLEALVLGLATANRDAAITALGRLNELRTAIAGDSPDLGAA